MKTNIVKVADLRDGERERLMICPSCGAEYSADRADYFLASEDTIMRCACDKPLVIASKRVTYEVIK